MQWLQSSNLSVRHGFSTRWGGVSPVPFDSLNLGGHEDAPENIFKNRELALSWLGLEPTRASILKQVHGTNVVTAANGIQVGDAQVTKEKDLPLVVNIADCYPLLFHDPVNQVIGAAHAGWRGTLNNIGLATVAEMKKLGADPREIRVAIGPGISREKFEVGKEVIIAFSEAGFPDSIFNKNRIDLLEANIYSLKKAGIKRSNISALERCSFEPDFFSYRRDKGVTGRMWGVIAL